MLDEPLLQEAEAFANSQTCAELFKRLKEQIMHNWATTAPLGHGDREHFYQIHTALELLEAALMALGKGRSVSAFNSSLAARQRVK